MRRRARVDGLETVDLLLTTVQRNGTRGQARQAAGTKIPQAEGIPRRPVAERGRACPRWCYLSVPLRRRGSSRRVGSRSGSPAHGLERKDARSSERAIAREALSELELMRLLGDPTR